MSGSQSDDLTAESFEAAGFIKMLTKTKDIAPYITPELPTEKEITSMCKAAVTILQGEDTILALDAPIKIVGDIRGQFHDLLRLFDFGGYPAEKEQYLFLGSYVDMGNNSVAVICLLLLYKIQYPKNFFMLRGQHEDNKINEFGGFKEECEKRYGQGEKVWTSFNDVFNHLPVCAIIGGKVFCVHGGLSHDVMYDLGPVRSIKRPIDVPTSGMLHDLLWSIPSDEHMTGPWAEIGMGKNKSYYFSSQVVRDFLKKHDFDVVVRAFTLVEHGFELFADRRLVTLFSVPNYCGEFDNAGAMMRIDNDLKMNFGVLLPQISRPPTTIEKAQNIFADPKMREKKKLEKARRLKTTEKFLGELQDKGWFDGNEEGATVKFVEAASLVKVKAVREYTKKDYKKGQACGCLIM